MDDFVKNKLTEWGLSEWVQRFQAEQIDEESLYCLEMDDIDHLITIAGPKAKFKKNLKLLKEEQNTNQETAGISYNQKHEEIIDLTQDLPSTSNKGKRKSDLQGESSTWQPPPKQQCNCGSLAGSDSDTRILSDVKNIMREVNERLHGSDKLSAFLKKKISDLKTDKKEVVGVFGRTGAGKSSLINAIIKEKDLLPTGVISACTAVMINVEANMCNSKYEAVIEFITKEEWYGDLWSFQTLKKDYDDYPDMVKKLSALYGEEWKGNSFKNLLEPKYFKNVPEFLDSKEKTLSSDTAKELSVKLVNYTEGSSKQGDGNKVQQWYWPLVKCVTVRVPNSPLLQHVTLVDLPGNGDRNKSRDKKWKEIVGNCSTVWIVAEITRAASEKEAREILESTCGHIGNGGQCLHFICTKSDPSVDHSQRVKNNKKAKEAVKKEFQELNKISKHFSEDSFKVFTVSAEEYLHRTCVNEDDNEIPKLQDILQNLNKCHSKTFIYVSGAYGILSLIEGARCRKQGVDKADDVCKELEKNMNEQLDQVETEVEEAIKVFEQCLSKGVKNSKTSEEKLKSFLDHDKQPSFFKTLQSVVKKDGTHITRKGEHIDLNMMLASCLTDSVDEQFRKTFPNDVQGGSFNGVINKFSLGTKSLIQDYTDFRLQLIFLQTEEETIKAEVNKTILRLKKKIYHSLTETIERKMKKGYKAAAKITGDGALKIMRKTIETYVDSNKEMYEKAKENLLREMTVLKVNIFKELEENMESSIKHSLKTDTCQLPDVSKHLQSVKQHYHELKEEMSPQ